MTSKPMALERLIFPEPPLTDGVVVLRRLVAADDEAVTRACSDPDTQRWLDFLPRPYRLEHAQAFIDTAAADWETGRAAVFAIADAQTSGLLGAIAVQEAQGRCPFIGYWVAPWARSRGDRPQPPCSPVAGRCASSAYAAGASRRTRQHGLVARGWRPAFSAGITASL
jgi:hypothetical protein